MADDIKSSSAVSGVSKSVAPGVNIKPQLLRVSTIVKNQGIDSVTAKAVMTANRLKPTNRIEPAKFLKLVEQFRNRKIKQVGRR